MKDYEPCPFQKSLRFTKTFDYFVAVMLKASSNAIRII